MQRIAVLGLGRFGMNLAHLLELNRVEVIAVASNHALVEEIKDDVTLAVCMDSTDEDALASHEVHQADVCVVAIGENFEASLLTATALKKGTNSAVSAGVSAVCQSAIAVARPASDCHRYFQRAARPRGSRTTSFR